MSKQWEYNVYTTSSDQTDGELREILDKRGSHGYELVSVIKTENRKWDSLERKWETAGTNLRFFCKKEKLSLREEIEDILER